MGELNGPGGFKPRSSPVFFIARADPTDISFWVDCVDSGDASCVGDTEQGDRDWKDT
jgi:hypothetical protein